MYISVLYICAARPATTLASNLIYKGCCWRDCFSRQWCKRLVRSTQPRYLSTLLIDLFFILESSYLSHARKYVRTIFFTRLQRQQLNSGWRCPPLLPSILCMVAIYFARVHVCLPKIIELKRIFNYVLEIRHVHYWLFKRRKRERAPKVSWLTGNNWIGRPKMPASCAL